MNKGFTLAEVLITLGIIGIVAAITLPNLIQSSFEKRTVSILRETQSILSQAIRMAEEENGDVSGWGFKGGMDPNVSQTIMNYLKPHMKIAVDCGFTNKKDVFRMRNINFLTEDIGTITQQQKCTTLSNY